MTVHQTNIPNDAGWMLRSEDFATALLDPDQPVPDGVGKYGATDDKRFSVYRNNVVSSLIDAMKAAYPAIHTIVGDDSFFMIARNFIDAHPPTSPMMLKYGDGFAPFLASFPPLRNSPFLTDLAKVERAWLEALHSLDAEPLAGETLQSVTEEELVNLTFSPHPSVAIVQSDFPVHDLFLARQEWPRPDGLALEEPQTVLVTRPYLTVEVIPLSRAQTRFYQLLTAGETLGLAMGEALETDADFNPAEAMAHLLTNGAFCGIQSAEDAA